jgi:multidrug efflux pump subunit AcrB
MHPIEHFVRSPVKVAVGVLLVMLFGVIGLLRMPMQLTPEVQIPTISIETIWPGASPQEVERQIVQEQEEQLKSVEGVTKMTSESREGGGTITMEFLVGTNMDQALLLVNSRLQQVREYPEDADQPVISTSSSSNSPIAWFVLGTKMANAEKFEEVQKAHPELREPLDRILATKNPALAVRRLQDLVKEHPEVAPLLPPDIDVDTLRRFAEDTIEAQFERVSGVSNSNVIGGRDPEVQVVVDPQKLAARQLTIQNVREALRGQNQDTSAGDLWEGKRRYVVRTLGQFRSAEQVENQLLSVVNGAPVYVRDVATVQLSFRKPDGFVRRYGSNCIAVNCLRETGANVMDIMEGLKQETQRLNDNVLDRQGLVLTQVYDETEYIVSARNLVRDNIFVGGFLTVVVLLVFLRDWRSTLVIGLAIPISIIGTFLILHVLGRSLNVISLAGLSFAVGMLVDNSVVVLENIFRYYQQGDRPWVASIKGAREVWMAVLSSTLTTLAVFIPIVFIEEEAGQLFRDIALAIGGAVGLSLIVSVIVVPLGASRILKEHTPNERTARRRWSPMSIFDFIGEAFTSSVVGMNAWALRGPLRQLLIVGVMMGLSAYVSYLLWPPVEYLPGGNRNLVFGIALPPPGYNLNTLAEIGSRVEDHLRPYWDIDPDSPEAKKLEFPPIEDFFFVARGRTVFLGLRSAEPSRARELVPLIMQLQREIPGTFVVAKQSSLFEQGLSAGRTVDVEITGPNLEKLVQIGGSAMMEIMAGKPGPMNEQFIAMSSKPAGGTWTLKYGDAATQPLAHDAKPADVEAALKALPPLADAQVTVSMDPVGRFAVKFDKLDPAKIAMLTGDDSQLVPPPPPPAKPGQEPPRPAPIKLTINNMQPPVIPGCMALPKPSLDLSNPEVHVEPLLLQSRDLALSASDLGYTVNALVDGAYATDFYPTGGEGIVATLDDGRQQRIPVGTKKIDMVIVGAPAYARQTQDLNKLPIATPDGHLITLTDVAQIVMSSGPEQINHRERQRAITIEVTPPPAMPLEQAIALIDAKVRQPLAANNELADAGYTINLRGTADKLQQTWNALKWNLLLAVLITYLLMAALFESWVYPFVVIVSVPLGAVGGIAALQLLNLALIAQNQPPQMLDVLTMLGFVILVGTVVNNAILIVEQTLHHMRNDGMARHAAILESVRNRIRPIFMTTTTTVFGLLPLVCFPGAGSELYRGLGAVVLGGLVVSTIFTLLLIPTLFDLTSRIGSLFRRAPIEMEQIRHQHHEPELVDAAK